MAYQYLFKPLQIGSVTIKNRLAFGPNCPFTAGDLVNGYFGEDSAYYYGERAKGGQGLIIIGNTRVSKGTAFWPYNDPSLSDDGAIEPLSKVAEEVHKYGTKLFIQLFYGGAERTMEPQQNNLYGDPDVEMAAYGPSQVPWFIIPGTTPKEMSVEEIAALVEDFGTAARRAKAAGLDGVEIHSWVEYLHWQFLSPFFNKRTDQYGGSMENRARFLVETLRKVREYVGEDFVVGYRIGTDALWPGDLSIDDIKEIVKYVNSQVKVDYINTGLGTFHSPAQSVAQMNTVDPGYEMPFTAQVKSVAGVPVLGIGSINDPRVAEDALAKGQCDVVVMVRQMFSDPEFANKAMAGREDDIRTCVRDSYCLGRTFRGFRVECIQNPVTGREKIWGSGTLKQADTRKKVLIVGGGPAGLETARIAGERGHDVVIYEREAELGGRVRLQAKLPRMSEIGNCASWLERQARKAGVRFVTNREVTPDNVDSVLAAEKPDVAVVATGSVGARDGMNAVLAAEIPGWQQDNVFTYEDVLAGKIGQVKKALLLDDVSEERVVGAVTLLATQAEQVLLVTRWATILQSPYISGSSVMPLLEQVFACKNIKLVPYTWVQEIDGRSVRLSFTPTGEESVEKDVDAVVLMTMFRSNDGLYPVLTGKVPEVHLIGDARAPRHIHEAVLEGHRLGRKL